MTGLLLGGRRENRLGQPAALDQTGRQLQSADCLRLLVLFPARPGEVAADDALDRHHVRPADHHAASIEGVDVGSVGKRQLAQIHAEQVMRDLELVEPEFADFGEDASLVGDRNRQHVVESTDAVGRHKQQPIVELVDITDFAATGRHSGDVALNQGRACHCDHTLKLVEGKIRHRVRQPGPSGRDRIERV